MQKIAYYGHTYILSHFRVTVLIISFLIVLGFKISYQNLVSERNFLFDKIVRGHLESLRLMEDSNMLSRLSFPCVGQPQLPKALLSAIVLKFNYTYTFFLSRFDCRK